VRDTIEPFVGVCAPLDAPSPEDQWPRERAPIVIFWLQKGNIDRHGTPDGYYGFNLFTGTTSVTGDVFARSASAMRKVFGCGGISPLIVWKDLPARAASPGG